MAPSAGGAGTCVYTAGDGRSPIPTGAGSAIGRICRGTSSEIRAGRKRGHWIWYVFPQLYGLGTSSMSRAYGVRGVEEAEAYLRDPVLRTRLIEITDAVARQSDSGVPFDTLMSSSIDALKLVSSLTLFNGVAERLAEADSELAAFADASSRLLDRAAREGYAPCERTLNTLRL